MSDFFWKQLTFLCGLMALGVLMVITVFSANAEIKDLDLWLHLKTGQYIVEHGEIPAHDILSCSLQNKPWFDHEWLFQVVIYTVRDAFGPDGLLTMQSVVVALSFLLLIFIAYRKDRQLLAVFFLLQVLFLYQSRFTIRPDIFSLLFFCIDMYVLAMAIESPVSVILMGVVQVLWVNSHGYFFMGPLLVFLALAAEFIKRRVPLPYEWNTVGRLNDHEFRRLKVIFAVVLLACLCNPSGLHGALYPLSVLFQTTGDSKIFFQHIYELQRPFNPGHWFDMGQNGVYKLLILISGLSFIFNRRNVDLSVLFVWIFFLLFSAAAIRNMIFFGFASYLVIMANSMHMTLEDLLPVRFVSARFKDITIIVLHVLLIIWLMGYFRQLSMAAYYDFDTYEAKSEFGGVSRRSFPDKAVDFMIKEKIKGNFFNDFNSGAYLIGRVFPNIKVYIDGRTEVYGGKFFENYQKIWIEGNKKVFKEAARKYNITGAFLNAANQEVPPKCLKLFYGMKDWRLVYFDHDGLIFLKDTPQNQPLIKRLAVDLAKWQPPPVDLERMGGARAYPYRNISRARILVDLKLDGPATRELNQAAKIAPDAMDIYQLRGDIASHQKKYREAFDNYRVAAMMFATPPNISRLAWAYARLGNNEQALKYYERFHQGQPDNKRVNKEIKRLKAVLKEKAKK